MYVKVPLYVCNSASICVQKCLYMYAKQYKCRCKYVYVSLQVRERV